MSNLLELDLSSWALKNLSRGSFSVAVSNSSSYHSTRRGCLRICIGISELYIDTDKKAYNALGFQRFGFLGLFPAVLSSAARAAVARVYLTILK